jgi:hypothetical protein
MNIRQHEIIGNYKRMAQKNPQSYKKESGFFINQDVSELTILKHFSDDQRDEALQECSHQNYVRNQNHKKYLLRYLDRLLSSDQSSNHK